MSEQAKTPMSDEHKEALADGRRSARAVKAYLEAVEANRPKRGRKRTPQSIEKRLVALEEEMASASPLKRLGLIQERLDLTEERERMGNTVDLSALEAGFISHAKDYSARKGITYSAWRELGLEPSVLSKAGITRGS